jgi:hypothetical protein
MQAREVLANVGEFGLFSIMPVSFFVAFLLLVFSFFVTLKFVNKNRSLLLVCQTLLLILFLNLTPAMVESTARFTTSYKNFIAVDYITQNGHLNPSSQWIHNWPGFSILLSIFSQITSIPGEFILLAYPAFFNILLFVSLFIFFRAISKDSMLMWISIWFFCFGNWVDQTYFSMQSLAFFAIVLILFLAFKNMNHGMRTRQWIVLFSLLSFYVTISHMLSSVAILCVILVLFLSRRMRRSTLFVALISLVSGWTVFNASSYLSGNLASTLGQIFNFSLIFQKNLTDRLTYGSVGHVLVAEVRVIYSVVIVAFALLGIILTWKNKKFGHVEKNVMLVLIGFSLLIIAFAYGGELFQRLYLFSLLPLAYFASRALKLKFVLCLAVIFFMIAAPSLNVIAHFGNEKMDYVPPSEAVGVSFLFGATTHGHVIGGALHIGDFRDLNYRNNYSFTSFDEIMSRNSSSSLWTERKILTEDRFVCISYEATTFYSLFSKNPSSAFIGDIQGNITQSTSYNLLYSNPSFSIYYSEG